MNVSRTSVSENSVDLGAVAITGNAFTYNLPDSSVTTFTATLSSTTERPMAAAMAGSEGLHVSPNPVNGSRACVSLPSGCTVVDLYTVSGRKVRSLAIPSAQAEFWLDTRLPAGVYVLRAIADNRVYLDDIMILR
ncbi:MAG: hypothetical protein A2487_20890 [Candidatus Raymondbacteria bacterium RifOxyC12_full_50_8]|nr:MAG: hypothetical protein A2487_20890 [Candidatus Raymondbacteria bacterium RifOxyC12_full_50_8]